jgi:mono/diheme cytochrome c family protein
MSKNHSRNSAVCCISLFFLLFIAGAMLFVRSGEAKSSGAQKQSGSAATGNPQNGKALYENQGCDKCHGSQGEGLAGSGQNAGIPRIASTSMSFSDFLQQVRKPKGQMPPFSSKKLSDAELRDVYAYLQTLKPMAEQPAATSAQATKGERLFNSYGCYECHGMKGQGSSSTGASRLGPPRIPLSARSAGTRLISRPAPVSPALEPPQSPILAALPAIFHLGRASARCSHREPRPGGSSPHPQHLPSAGHVRPRL